MVLNILMLPAASVNLISLLLSLLRSHLVVRECHDPVDSVLCFDVGQTVSFDSICRSLYTALISN